MGKNSEVRSRRRTQRLSSTKMLVLLSIVNVQAFNLPHGGLGHQSKLAKSISLSRSFAVKMDIGDDEKQTLPKGETGFGLGDEKDELLGAGLAAGLVFLILP